MSIKPYPAHPPQLPCLRFTTKLTIEQQVNFACNLLIDTRSSSTVSTYPSVHGVQLRFSARLDERNAQS